jgi:glutamate-1-semialdehyde 2,1-aminomutase
MTGFRVGRGGYQERCGVTPDLTALGKVIGGGLPSARLAALRKSWTRSHHSARSIRQGLFRANPVAMAAGACATT